MDNSNNCFCGKEFTEEKSLYAHLRKMHDIEPELERDSTEEQNFSSRIVRLICPNCGIQFTEKESFYAHLQKMHDIDPKLEQHTDEGQNFTSKEVQLICPKCGIEFTQKKNLYTHLRKMHDIEPDLERHRADGQNICPNCGIEFTLKKNLYAHLRKMHGIEPLSLKSRKKLSCSVCNQKFSCRTSLIRHFRAFHKVKQREHDYSITDSTRKPRLICPQEFCDEKVLFYDSLRQHLAQEHEFEVEGESLTFSSMKEFETWKDEIEQKTFSSYTKDSGRKPLKNGINRMFFNCHRSYSYTCKGKNIRATKSMGSNKIGRACPSRLEVTLNENSDINEPAVSVKYWKTHCGHTLEVERISLNKDIRLKIAGKLKEGVTFDRVLDSIRDPACDNDKTSPRVLLLNRKDIHNIVRDFKINRATKIHNKESSDKENTEKENDDKEKVNNNEIVNSIEMSECDNRGDSDLKNKRTLINKSELLLDLVNNVELSDENILSVEKQIDKVIEMLNELNKSK